MSRRRAAGAATDVSAKSAEPVARSEPEPDSCTPRQHPGDGGPPRTRLSDSDLREIVLQVVRGEPIAEEHRPLLAFLLLDQLGKRSPRREKRYRVLLAATSALVRFLAEAKRQNPDADVAHLIDGSPLQGAMPKMEAIVESAAARFGVKRRQFFNMLRSSGLDWAFEQVRRGFLARQGRPRG